MHFEKIHNKGQAQLFKSRYLEIFTKTHPLVAWAMYFPLALYLNYFSIAVVGISIAATLFSFVGGIFFWTFFEYVIHRFAFHFEATSGVSRKVVYLIHGNHHEYPRDKQRLFMPPLPSILLAGTIYFIQYVIAFLLGLQMFVASFFAGFIFGYLLYGSIHYAIHAWNPPFKWMKPLWRNHHLHHYKEQDLGFCVSSTLWDRVFGTMYNLKEEKENREEVSKLMYEKSN